MEIKLTKEHFDHKFLHNTVKNGIRSLVQLQLSVKLMQRQHSSYLTHIHNATPTLKGTENTKPRAQQEMNTDD